MKKKQIVMLGSLAILSLSGCDNKVRNSESQKSPLSEKANTSDKKDSASSKPSISDSSSQSKKSSASSKTLTKLEVSFDKSEIAIGEKATLSVKAFYSNGSQTSLGENEVEISVVGESAARIGFVFTGIKEGETSVQVSFEGKTETVSLVVSHVKVLSLSLTEPLSTTLSIGNTLQLEYSLYPENAKVVDLQFASSAPDVLSIDQSGLLSALKEGEATISVSCLDENKTGKRLSSSLDFHVAVIHVTGVESDKDLLLEVGTTKKLGYTVLPEDSANKNVTFASSAEDVVQVDADGTLTALKSGTSTITVTTQDGGFTSKTAVTVKDSYDMHLDSVKEKIEKGKDYEYRSVLSYEEDYSNPNAYRSKKKKVSSKVYSNGTDYAHIVTEKKIYKDSDDPIEDTKSYSGISEDDNKYYSFTYDNLENKMSEANAYFTNSSQMDYQNKSRLFYDSDLGYSSYGLASIAENFLTSSSYFGRSALSELNRWTIEEDKITLSAKGEDTSASLYSTCYYDVSLTLEFNSANAITKLEYKNKEYDRNGYDMTNHAIKTDAVPEEDVSLVLKATYGNRTGDSDTEFAPSGLYFSSPEFVPDENAEKDDDGHYKIRIGSSTEIVPIDSAHPYATNMIDKISVKSIDNEDVLKDDSTYSRIELKGLKKGTATVTFVNSKNQEFTQTFAVVPPNPTSMDVRFRTDSSSSFSYCSSTVIKANINSSLQFTASVYPNGADQEFSLTCSDTDVTITKETDFYQNTHPIYSVTSKKAGTYELVFKAQTLEKKYSIKFTDPDDTITDEKAKGLLIDKSYSGSGYTLTFKEDSTFEMIGDDGNMYGTYSIVDLKLSFVVTSHDKDKYFEVDSSAPISINAVTLDNDWDGKNLKLMILCPTSDYYSRYIGFTKNN